MITRHHLPTSIFMIKVAHIELGYDFITLYFPSWKDMTTFAIKSEDKLRRLKFPHMELQRKEFRHLPGDVPHFHSTGDAKELWGDNYHHFHIIYPTTPTDEDLEYLYTHLNDENRQLEISRDIQIIDRR